MAHGLNPKSMIEDGARISALASQTAATANGKTIFTSRKYPHVGYASAGVNEYAWFLKSADGWTAVGIEEAQTAVGYRLPERTRKPGVAYFWKMITSLTDAEWEAYTPDLTGTIHTSKEDARRWYRENPTSGGFVLMNSEKEFFASESVFESKDGCWFCYLGIPDIHAATAAARLLRTG